MANSLLPGPFSDLEPMFPTWGLATEKARFEKRISSDLADVKAFNDAMYARIHDIIAYLDTFPLDAMPADAANLLTLALAYMETSHPVDLGWRTVDLDDAFDSDRFEFHPPSR